MTAGRGERRRLDRAVGQLGTVLRKHALREITFRKMFAVAQRSVGLVEAELHVFVPVISVELNFSAARVFHEGMQAVLDVVLVGNVRIVHFFQAAVGFEITKGHT